MMNLSNYIDTRFPEHKDKIYEFLRFCIVGTIAAGIHYGIYCLLQMYIEVNIAYTVGYLTSLVCNFFLTSYITFRRSPSAKKAAGFGLSNLVNYMLHIFLFNAHFQIRLTRFMIAVPTNFVLLRWVFKHKSKTKTDNA